MSKTTEHGRLIAEAAKTALTPLGCHRKGRSRLWYSDERFWVITIEFQPSGWSKGSYLNVGAAWLWHNRTGFGFDAGYRVADFIPFESNDQFGPLIGGMAARAADEVCAIRAKFSSLQRIYDYLLEHATRDGWRIYHAAIAAGLLDDLSNASLLFRRLEQWPTDGYDWQVQLKATSAKLARHLDDPGQFRDAVIKLIGQRRSIIDLKPDPYCLD